MAILSVSYPDRRVAHHFRILQPVDDQLCDGRFDGPADWPTGECDGPPNHYASCYHRLATGRLIEWPNRRHSRQPDG